MPANRHGIGSCRMNATFHIRFWSKVGEHSDSTKCWLWTGHITKQGYGQICLGGHQGVLIYVHRASWLIHYGSIQDGLYVLHHCDTPCCVNPAHLFIGTAADNAHDMISKNRHKFNMHLDPGRNLQWNDVEQIRNLLSKGYQGKELAKQFHTTPSTISLIKNRKSYKSAR